ncbi:hypothetical protein [Streptomyces halstedii]|uniref:hypothetical protein n=1 Tax=Streptomyces halstedii TaxID=1944 RepID=UPI003821E95A
MSITRALKRGAGIALLSALAVLAVPIASTAPTGKTAAVADPGWGSTPVDEMETVALRPDPGWG